MLKMAVNNESIGISAEVAIAKSFNLDINDEYVYRSEQSIVNLLLKNDNIISIFKKEHIPIPIEHVAEKQNPVDFLLEGNKTLSVKTNQEGLGKVAPQIIGQATSETYFRYLEKYFDNVLNLKKILSERNLEDTYEARSMIFKWISMEFTYSILYMYWEELFHCDYYLHFFNLDNHLDPLKNYVFLKKKTPPEWDESKFSFTKTLDRWEESNTLKYCGISIGEFQVHRNRNCFKFRFNMKGIMEVFTRGII